jgi:hypothetical protein
MPNNYEILKGLPGTGPMYVTIGDNSYHSDYSEGFVIRFSKKDGTHWVGNFKRGLGELEPVLKLAYVHYLLNRRRWLLYY